MCEARDAMSSASSCARWPTRPAAPSSTAHENGVSAGGWFSLRDGLQLEAFITTNEAAAVPVLAHALREALTEAEENPVLVALGATTVLQQVTLHEEDTTFRVTLSVTDAQVRELLANALRLVQSASVD